MFLSKNWTTNRSAVTPIVDNYHQLPAFLQVHHRTSVSVALHSRVWPSPLHIQCLSFTPAWPVDRSQFFTLASSYLEHHMWTWYSCRVTNQAWLPRWTSTSTSTSYLHCNRLSTSQPLRASAIFRTTPQPNSSHTNIESTNLPDYNSVIMHNQRNICSQQNNWHIWPHPWIWPRHCCNYWNLAH